MSRALARVVALGSISCLALTLLPLAVSADDGRAVKSRPVGKERPAVDKQPTDAAKGHKPTTDDERPAAAAKSSLPNPADGHEPAVEPKPEKERKPASELPPGKVVFAQSDVERRIFSALDEPTEVQYLDTILTDIAMDIELRHSIPVVVDGAALTAAGKDKTLKLSGSRRDVSLRNALRTVLGAEDLACIVRNDALVFTTKEGAKNWAPIRIYQIHDLLADEQQAGLERLVDLICSTIEPESWRTAGGTAGEVRPFVGPGLVVLVITQTEDVHEKIAGLLTTLREARDATVEAAQRDAASRTKSPANSGGGFF